MAKHADWLDDVRVEALRAANDLRRLLRAAPGDAFSERLRLLIASTAYALDDVRNESLRALKEPTDG